MCPRVNKSMRAAALLSLLVLWALAFPALAQDRGGRQSLDRVLPEIRRTTPGTFYDAEGPFLMPNGQVTYRIKWMTPDGRIIWFYADARNGHVLGLAQQPPLTRRYRNNAPPGRDDWRDDGRNNWGNDGRSRDDRWNRGGGGDRGGGHNNNGSRGGHSRHPGG